MRYYPLFLDLDGASCLVAGLGDVGLRKLRSLLACAVREVLVLDCRQPADVPAWQEVLRHPAVRFERRDMEMMTMDDFDFLVQGRALVFAATASGDLNRALAACCRKHGVPCNVANAPAAGSFIVPARVESGPITLALSTGGASPALAKVLKQDLEKWLDGRYARVANILEKIRPLVLAQGLDSATNAEIFRGIVAQRQDFADALNAHDLDACKALLQNCLPPALFMHMTNDSAFWSIIFGGADS